MLAPVDEDQPLKQPLTGDVGGAVEMGASEEPAAKSDDSSEEIQNIAKGQASVAAMKIEKAIRPAIIFFISKKGMIYNSFFYLSQLGATQQVEQVRNRDKLDRTLLEGMISETVSFVRFSASSERFVPYEKAPSLSKNLKPVLRPLIEDIKIGMLSLRVHVALCCGDFLTLARFLI